MSQRYIGGVVTETINVAQPPWTGSWTQQAALQGFAGAQAPLRITNSLRFRSSASATLSRTPATTSNQTTFTFSFWFKTSTTGSGRIYTGRTGINFPAFGISVGVSGGSAMTINPYGPGAAIQ